MTSSDVPLIFHAKTPYVHIVFHDPHKVHTRLGSRFTQARWSRLASEAARTVSFPEIAALIEKAARRPFA